MVFLRTYAGFILVLVLLSGTSSEIRAQVPPTEVVQDQEVRKSRDRRQARLRRSLKRHAGFRLGGFPRPTVAQNPDTLKKDQRLIRKEKRLENRIEQLRNEITADSSVGNINKLGRWERKEERLSERDRQRQNRLSQDSTGLLPKSDSLRRGSDTTWSGIPEDIRERFDTARLAVDTIGLLPDTLAQIPLDTAPTTVSLPPDTAPLTVVPASGPSHLEIVRHQRRQRASQNAANPLEFFRNGSIWVILGDLILPIGAVGLFLLMLIAFTNRKARQTIFTPMSFLFLLALAVLVLILGVHELVGEGDPYFPWLALGGVLLTLVAYLIGRRSAR
ncbi:MAG: hypothetical protein AAGN35_24825 [Bacteroidota bacterium]